MEKWEIISNSDIWLDMRDIRNKIVHDYMPEQIAEMYVLIRHEFYDEFSLVVKKFKEINLRCR